MQLPPVQPTANWSSHSSDLAALRAARLAATASAAAATSTVPEQTAPTQAPAKAELIVEPPKEPISAMLLQLLLSLWEASGKAVQVESSTPTSTNGTPSQGGAPASKR